MRIEDFFATASEPSPPHLEDGDETDMNSIKDASGWWLDNLPQTAFENSDKILPAMLAASWRNGGFPLTGDSKAPTLFSIAMYLKPEHRDLDWYAKALEVLARHGDWKLVCTGHSAVEVEGDTKSVEVAARTLMSHSGIVKISGPRSPIEAADDYLSIYVWTISPQLAVDLYAMMMMYCEYRQHDGTVYMMTMTKDGPQFKAIGKGGSEMVPENYTPEVNEAFDRIKLELVAENPRGRLSVISGPPGTGKTYLIRGLLRAVPDAIFVIVPQQSLAALLAPDGVAALTDFRAQNEDDPIVLILEDADDALAPRREGDTSIISSLLNLGDGIVGSAVDVRVVATTNRDHQEFDEAILRPGRLSTHVVVGDLDVDTANAVYKRLTGQTVGVVRQPCSLATVYQMAYDAGWLGTATPKRLKKMGF